LAVVYYVFVFASSFTPLTSVCLGEDEAARRATVNTTAADNRPANRQPRRILVWVDRRQEENNRSVQAGKRGESIGHVRSKRKKAAAEANRAKQILS